MACDANPVNWFEIPVNDMPRAIAFYKAAFAVEITEVEKGPVLMGWFPMIPDAPGAAGTLMKAEGYTPSHDGTVVYLHVASIDPTLKSIEAAGGKTLLERMSIDEHGFIAHFEDSEGNRIALHEKPAA